MRVRRGVVLDRNLLLIVLYSMHVDAKVWQGVCDERWKEGSYMKFRSGASSHAHILHTLLDSWER